jgi:anti-anti-sigma regulatory factor
MLVDPGVQVGVNADRTATLRIAGEISSDTLSGLRDTIDGAGGTGPLIVDLTEVTHLDNAGIELLFDVAGERGLEIVMGPGCAVFPVVQVSGLCEVAVVLCR